MDPEPSAPRDPDTEECLKFVKDIVSDDVDIRRTLRSEAIQEDELMNTARDVLDEATFDFASKLQELRSAEQQRDEILATADAGLYTLGGYLVFLSAIGFIVLLAIGIFKWTGHLLRWPLWPFIAGSSALFTLAAVISGVGNFREEKAQKASGDSVTAESLRRSLRDQLRSLVVIPAVERAISFNFIAPTADIINITDAPSLSSLVESSGRIQTGSYRDVFMHLRRFGGAAIGLAGSRGAGKSELLRAFCEDPTVGKSIDAGGVIGIIIPVPVAYQAESFLRLLIRRLAEAVPDYDKHVESRTRMLPSTAVNALAALFAAACITAGLLLVFGFPTVSRDVLGWLLFSLGCLAALWLLMQVIKLWRSLLHGGRRSQLNRLSPLSIGKPDLAQEGARINKQLRERIAVTAASFAQRVRYLETRSVNWEGSASWQNIGLKRKSGVSLGQVPMTEPDLVLELSRLIRELHLGGYEIRIGIDELDKLVEGDDAERFLTDIKVLFSIQYCSFILTISENASSQFARRGMPIRDVFDSSLDAVVMVQPLTFREAKRLIRARLSWGDSEKISDSQALLCYSLAGGLPRDFLRFCRQLGEFNSKMGGNTTLDKVLMALLGSEVRVRLDGILAALQSRDEGSDASAFIAELEMIHDAYKSDRTMEALGNFLSADRDFFTFCRSTNFDGSRNSDGTRDIDWIRATRRQLCSYLYFIQSIREAFGLGWGFTEDDKSNADQFISAFEFLADARRQIEMDAAAGWRRTTYARMKLGLALIDMSQVGVNRGDGHEPNDRKGGRPRRLKWLYRPTVRRIRT